MCEGEFTLRTTEFIPVDLEKQVQPRLRQLKLASRAQLVSNEAQEVVKGFRVAVGTERTNLNVHLSWRHDLVVRNMGACQLIRDVCEQNTTERD